MKGQKCNFAGEVIKLMNVGKNELFKLNKPFFIPLNNADSKKIVGEVEYVGIINGEMFELHLKGNEYVYSEEVDDKYVKDLLAHIQHNGITRNEKEVERQRVEFAMESSDSRLERLIAIGAPAEIVENEMKINKRYHDRYGTLGLLSAIEASSSKAV